MVLAFDDDNMIMIHDLIMLDRHVSKLRVDFGLQLMAALSMNCPDKNGPVIRGNVRKRMCWVDKKASEQETESTFSTRPRKCFYATIPDRFS